ncbi:hypothetical protein GCM10022406_01310 [Hymenobacter algoricola]|uniref:ABC transporter domain-containing protein n=1 Tax=Hymenobacter algoricola TaxID=486267 RepID=A0ABP7MBJ2_9BACT
MREKNAFALHDIHFTQPRFRRLALAGETGAGKSTLLQCIAGLIQPQAGQIFFEQERVKGPAEQLVPGHPGIAYLSQHFELPRFLRVEQALRYADKLPAGEAAALYEVCRIGHLLLRRTDELSGGERQRIALARLLLSAPRLLLLDEPFSNLDRGHKNLLKAVLEDLSTQLGITCLLVSHDPADTLSWAEEILVLRQGQVVQQAPPAQIYRQPADEYTAGLFGDYNLITGPLLPLVAKLAGRRRTSQQLLVRPEDVLLTAADTSDGPGLAAEVLSVRFFGSYSEVEVGVQGERLTVKTSAPAPAVGRRVTLTLAAAGGWYL